MYPTSYPATILIVWCTLFDRQLIPRNKSTGEVKQASSAGVTRTFPETNFRFM